MTLKEYKQKQFEKFKDYYYEITMQDYYENLLLETIVLSAGVDLFLDVGSNRGDMTKFVLQLKKKIKILAFEPDRRMMIELKKNVKDKKVEFIQRAVWKRNWVNPLYINSDSTQSSLVFPLIKKNVLVRTVKLDNYFKLIQSHKNVLIKIDVEGGEPDVFEGMKKIFKKIKQPLFIIFEYSHKWLQNDRERQKIFTNFFDNSFTLYRLNTFGLEQMGSDISWVLKKYHYSLMLATKNFKMHNKTELLPSKGSLVNFIPMQRNVDIDFSQTEKEVNNESLL